MERLRKGFVFESSRDRQEKMVRKSATQSRAAHYALKKHAIDFMISDTIDESSPIVVRYFDDENKIFIGKRTFLKRVKRDDHILFETDIADQMMITDIEDGIEVSLKTTLKVIRETFLLTLDSVGDIVYDDQGVTISKDRKVVYRMGQFQLVSFTGSQMPISLTFEKETDAIMHVALVSDENAIQDQEVTLRFQVMATSPVPISTMNAIDLNLQEVAPRGNKTYRVGRYADNSRVTRSNANTVKITINPEYIRDEAKLKPKTDFTVVLKLYHLKPSVAELAKVRSGYKISAKYMKTRYYIPTEASELTIDLTETLRQCLAKDEWTPFDVEIKTASEYMYARTSGSQSGTSDFLTTDDYMDICNLSYAHTDKRPKIVLTFNGLNELEKTTPFLEVDNGKSGNLSVNNFTGEFTFRHDHTPIYASNLTVDLFHIYSSAFTKTAVGSNNQLGLGVGWKTNLHQWIQKEPYDPTKQELKVIYTDGFGVNHVFYEKWYYKVKDTKHYIDRSAIYIDELGELKYKSPTANKVYAVTYEVKSKDGLTLTTSAGMFGYRDKTKFTEVKRNYYQNKTLLEQADNGVRVNLFVSKVSDTGDYTIHDSKFTWLNDKDKAYITQKSSNNFESNVGNFSAVQSASINTPTALDLPLFQRNGWLYSRYFSEYQILRLRNQYIDNFNHSIIFQKPEWVNLTVKKDIVFDTTLLDYYETDEMIQLKEQVKNYDKALKDANINVESISKELEDTLDGLEEIKEASARLLLSISQVGYTAEDNGETFTTPLAKIGSYSIQGSIDHYAGQIEQMESKIKVLKETIARSFTIIDEYEVTRTNLNTKLEGLIKEQKRLPTDFITDEKGTIWGFDYYGRLVLIADKFEKTIRIHFQEDSDLLDTIETDQGSMCFTYGSNGLLKEIIDIDGKITRFEYQDDRLLKTIGYDTFEDKKSKFTYYNEQLSDVTDPSGLRLNIEYQLGSIRLKQDTTTAQIDNKGLKTMESGFERILDAHLVKQDLASTLTNVRNGAVTSYVFDEKGRVLSSVSTLGNQTDYGYAKYNDHGDCVISSSYEKKYLIATFIKQESMLTHDRTTHFSSDENRLNTVWRGLILNSDTLIYYFDFKQTDVLAHTRVQIEAFYNDGQHLNKELTLYNNQSHVQVPVGVDKDKIELISILVADETLFSNFGLATGLGTFNTYDESFNKTQNKTGLTITSYLNYDDKQPTRIESIDKFGIKRFLNVSYNEKHQLTYSKDQDDNVEERYYNDRGELLESVVYNQKQATNKTVNTYEYDDIGNITEMNGLLPNKEGKINPEKQTFYPGTKKLNYVTSPNGLVTSYGFDFYTQQVVSMSADVDGLGNTTNYNYQYGFLTALSHQEFDIHYAYDGKGRKVAVDVACNNVVKFTYDDAYLIDGYKGSKTETEYYNHKLLDNKITVIKDIYGKTREVTDSTGLNIHYEYDEFDRLVSTTSTEESTNMTYDARDHVSYLEIDQPNLGKITHQSTYATRDLLESVVTNISNPNRIYGYQTGYIYDVLDRVIQTHLTYNNGVKSDEKMTNEYDPTNRVIKTRIHLKDSRDMRNKYQLSANEYLYLKSGAEATSLIKKDIQTVLNDIKDVRTYEYDEMGNIVTIETDSNHITYTYDKLSRITRENNQKLDLTKTFEYDESGNILRSKKYTYTTKELGIPLENNRYSYNQGNYQDQLIDFNNQKIIYDGLGRPTTYRGKTLSWSPNSTLSTYNDFEYTYNNQSIRIKKVINDTTHKYYVNGTTILLEELTTNNTKKYLKYKYFGDKLSGFNYDDVDYYYLRNIQGDITSIVNKEGIEVASYTYDAWGNHVVNNLTEDNIGDINPFRYRGYYYDKEIKLYYLNARYYDPETGRFISQDHISYLEPDTINGLNLYAYCGNNPVMNVDQGGSSFWKSVGNFFANASKVIGGGLLAIAGGLFVIATLPIALVVPGGGFLTQFGFSVAMYGGFVAASVFDSQVKSDMQAIGWNPFNNDGSVVLNSSAVSFYKGMPVFRTSGSRSGSYLGIFLNKEATSDVLKHEWGHGIQHGIMGSLKYLTMIGLPSWKEWRSDKWSDYYNSPWEITADIFGGANNASRTQSEINRGWSYLAISTTFWFLGYLYLIGR